MVLALKPNDACTSVIWVIIASDKGLSQSRLLHQYYLIVNWTTGYTFHWTLTQNAIMSKQGNEFVLILSFDAIFLKFSNCNENVPVDHINHAEAITVAP